MESVRKELQEIRRRLGPYTGTAHSYEPWRVNQAETARLLAQLVQIVDKLAEKIEAMTP